VESSARIAAAHAALDADHVGNSDQEQLPFGLHRAPCQQYSVLQKCVCVCVCVRARTCARVCVHETERKKHKQVLAQIV
jgi:hypothetical protein